MRALISVFDKDGIVDFAGSLAKMGVDIISSGGTYNLLAKEGIKATEVSDVTGFAECLGGRVKTLHPKIHAGILANRKLPEHMQTLKELEIEPIDIVVVNLYPFEEVIAKTSHTFEEAVENIDIGGPTLIRAAAKNHDSVIVITDKNDYREVIKKLHNKNIDAEYKKNLAKKAFLTTAKYDGKIYNYLEKTLSKEEYPENIILSLKKKQNLRYGENPHQNAGYYENENSGAFGVEKSEFLHGKELSYNNINDSQCAIDLAKEFDEPVCVAVKHATPCGVACAKSISEAFRKANESDPMSIFGGIICFNGEIDEDTALQMADIFLEVIIAPSFTQKAIEVLTKKKNLRLLKLDLKQNLSSEKEYKGVAGGMLVQDSNEPLFGEELKVVTKISPTDEELEDLKFAMKIVKHVKSNAIVLVKNKQTLGVGGGETSRIWAAEAAIERAGVRAKGSVMSSDAFFPFSDVVEAAAKAGVKAIIQPGGSTNDDLSIAACDENGISMIMTKVRHFKH